MLLHSSTRVSGPKLHIIHLFESSRISGLRNGFIASLDGKSFLSSDPLFGSVMAQSVLIARRLPFLPSSGYRMHVIGLIELQAEYIMCNK